MLDFSTVRSGAISYTDLAANLTAKDLRALTNQMIDEMLEMIAHCTDADVSFTPNDPTAYDQFAQSEEELNIAWTLGHVIVHTTASAEEAAAIACELARGVPFRGGRSRVEVPWRTVTTIAQCRRRLEESRRMCLAMLDAWPDQPDLQNSYQFKPGSESRNAVVRFVLGLRHDDDHLKQIADIVRQARTARN